MRAYPKKRLGQNFLVEKNIRKKILDICSFKQGDTVLEIGAGRGEMTCLIAPLVKRLIAVEFDRDLCEGLKPRLKEFGNVELICGDILKVNIAGLGKGKRIKVFGNIPYYLTTPIIIHLVKHKKHISNVYLTVQKEFARRIVAKPGSKDYSSFSIYCGYYLMPRLDFVISRGCFYPVPKVDSAFLNIEVRRRPPCIAGNEEFFFKIVRAAFNQRRKTLKNSLKKIIDPVELSSILAKRGLRPDIRAEKLSIDDFAYISRKFLTQKKDIRIC
ncbi:MAG: 16S rRNA (adenine(1518)-N(6)/adenine(1519)-N(6))-dimethyltransferase RsmA [Candidatus Omnitrophica bacterium]|nr:16S rRNA (adenine(1518)-N(6)/adenine(1519)-N(6))-dimethyltransferase RsmA [Candidatus Omnitrophota bacterium]